VTHTSVSAYRALLPECRARVLECRALLMENSALLCFEAKNMGYLARY